MSDYIETALQKFNLHDAEVSKMHTAYMPLIIGGIDDKVGYRQVKEARLIVKTTRVAIEKIRKELKADSLAYGRSVDGEAKRITALLSPIEDHLHAQEKAIDDEKERIKREVEQTRLAKIQARIDAIKAVSNTVNYISISNMKDSEFEAELARATELWRQEQKNQAIVAEQARLAAIAAENARKEEEEVRAREREKLAEIAREQARQRKELEAKEREIEAERARLAEQERKLKEAEESKARESEKVNLPEVKIIETIPEKEIETPIFPCEKENPPTLPDKYQVLLKFVKELSHPEEDMEVLVRDSNRDPDEYGDVECFYSGVIQGVAETTIRARKVLTQIGEDQ